MSLENAIALLKKMEDEPGLAAKLRGGTAEARFAAADAMGLPITLADLTNAMKYDYRGKWFRPWKVLVDGDGEGGPDRDGDGASVDALPDLSGDYALTAEQISAYQRDGHSCLRGVASPAEATAYRPVFLRASQKYNSERRSLDDRDAVGKMFLQTINLWVRDPGVRKFILARRFAKIAAQLMGAKGARIYYDMALYKEPGGVKTPWHQDHRYWPLDSDVGLTMWMPLVDASTETGTMTFASGSQTNGYMGDLPLTDDTDKQIEQYIADKQYPKVYAGAMKAGDATFHNGWTLHDAAGNNGTITREVLTVIYYPEGTRLIEPKNVFMNRALTYMFVGRKPGDLADSPVNPVLYSE